MEQILRATADHIDPVGAEIVARALAGPHTRALHDECANRVPALAVIETSSTTLQYDGCALRAVAWNAERLKYGPASAALMRGLAPDVLLVSEADVGMARAGNRHTIRDLAGALGFSFAYGVEFVETDLGDEREKDWHKGERNTHGYHGNAVLSRFALEDCFVIRLDDGGVWYGHAGKPEQTRIGARMAIGARLAGSRIWIISIHLESSTDASDRAAQIERFLKLSSRLVGDDPVIVGGDLNTLSLPRDDARLVSLFDDPSAIEPLFGHFATAGYEWRHCNNARPTMRTRPDGSPRPPFTRIDWLLTRGMSGEAPETIAAVDSNGVAISDHEAIAATFRLPG